MQRERLSQNMFLEYYGNEVLAYIQRQTAEQEKESGMRLFRRTVARAPVSKQRWIYKRTRMFMGKEVSNPHWRSRYPGRLKASIRMLKSKYKDGGWIVWAGSYTAYYARFAEYGTKMRRQKSTGRFTGSSKATRFMRRALTLEKNAFIRGMRKALGV